MAEAVNRRDRVRAETVREIKDTARRVLVEQGAGSLALRAIAREMGMTAPALYRYFASREDLEEHVVADLYAEVCETMETARDAAEAATPATQLLAVSRAFRSWATAHRTEFGLLFGSPVEGLVRAEEWHERTEGPAHEAKRRFGAIFAALVAQIYLARVFPVPAEEELDPALRSQLVEWKSTFPVPLPLGVMQVFLSCWIRLYGTVCMEVFGHLRFALADAEPMFEAELRGLGELLGIADEYRAPVNLRSRSAGGSGDIALSTRSAPRRRMG